MHFAVEIIEGRVIKEVSVRKILKYLKICLRQRGASFAARGKGPDLNSATYRQSSQKNLIVILEQFYVERLSREELAAVVCCIWYLLMS